MYIKRLFEILLNLVYWLCIVRLTLKWLIRIGVITRYLHFAGFLAASVVLYVILDRLFMFFYIRCKRNDLRKYADIKMKWLAVRKFGKQTGKYNISEIMQEHERELAEQQLPTEQSERKQSNSQEKNWLIRSQTTSKQELDKGCSGTFIQKELV